MTYIPNNPIIRSVIKIMKRYRELHAAETRRKMTTHSTYAVYQKLSHLLGDLWETFLRQLPKVERARDSVQKRVDFFGCHIIFSISILKG
jgi:hypothetical protein